MDDLISRQAAIDALRGYLVGKRCPDDGTLTCRLIENEVINKLPTIHPELGTNLATHGTDCISRQAVLSLHIYTEKNLYGNIIREYVDIEDVKQLPPIRPEIIYCKDCTHYESGICKKAGLCVNKSPNGFCDWGERREHEHTNTKAN